MAQQHLALYRKWRPLTFDDVVGQDHITSALKAQIRQGRTSHAYIFTGTRGTGKTSCAKILARALCCLDPRDGNPCNECDACREMLADRALDITEIDAASNNGVDNIRELKEEAVYAPVFLSKRVYIIDEVHMLSPGAFNALLKTLEEPPEHVYFILATTEIHKVPTTILSRCQRYDFHRIGADVIAARLSKICREEGVELEPRAADLLAKLGDGSMRDAISLLDRSMPASGSITWETVVEALGMPSPETVATILKAVASKDAQKALESFGQCYSAGRDIVSLFDEMLSMIRDLMIIKQTGADTPLVNPGALDRSELESLASSLTVRELEFFALTVGEMLGRITRNAMRRTDGDLCLIKMACRGNAQDAPSAPAAAPVKREQPVKAAPVEAEHTPKPAEKKAEVPKQAPADELSDTRQKFLGSLQGKLIPPVYKTLTRCEINDSGAVLKIKIPESDSVFFDRQSVRQSLTEAASACGFESVLLEKIPDGPAPDIDSILSRARELGIKVEDNQ